MSPKGKGFNIESDLVLNQKKRGGMSAVGHKRPVPPFPENVRCDPDSCRRLKRFGLNAQKIRARSGNATWPAKGTHLDVTYNRGVAYNHDSLYRPPICDGISSPNSHSGHTVEVPRAATKDRHTNSRGSNDDVDHDGAGDGYHGGACDTFDVVFARSAKVPLPEAPEQMLLDC